MIVFHSLSVKKKKADAPRTSERAGGRWRIRVTGLRGIETPIRILSVIRRTGKHRFEINQFEVHHGVRAAV